MTGLFHSFSGWLHALRYNMRPLEAQLRHFEPGKAAPSRSQRLCIFAHFDPDGIVAPYVVHYLAEIRRVGADIVFISTAPSLDRTEIDKIRPLCRDVVLRINISADFGSWKLGLHHIRETLPSYRQLILANDSVYGPFASLAPIFAEMEARDLDLWGFTESQEDAHHVQSYFLVFEQRLLRSAFFSSFWNSFRQESNKRRLILTNEIGLSQRLRQQRFRWESWISSEQVGSRTNPTLFYWDSLIEQFDFPFLKTEIVRRNRFHSQRAEAWREIIEVAFPHYDCELIADHLRRVGAAVPLTAA